MTPFIQELKAKAVAATKHYDPEWEAWLESGKLFDKRNNPIADIRGWGYLTGGGFGALGLSQQEALGVQKDMLSYIAAASPSTILALIEENERLRSLKSKALDAGIHLSLSFADIRNNDMSPSPDSNEWHRQEAARLAKEAYDEHKEAEIESMRKEMRKHNRAEARRRRAALKEATDV